MRLGDRVPRGPFTLSPDSTSERLWRQRILWLLPSLPIAIGVVLARGYPTTGSDTGIFLSVAGRLLAGDRLYRDVFDNKDPVFYYTQTLALWAGGWRGPFLIDIAWLAVASVSAYLLLRLVSGDVIVAVFGQLLYPLLLTGLHYYAADGETPALSLLPLFAYLVLRGNVVLGGVIAATALLLRVNVLPILGALAVGAWLTSSLRGRRLVILAVATASAVGVALVALAVRGEARAYLDTLGQNFDYSRRLLLFHHRPSGVAGHLEVVWQKMPTAAWFQLGTILVTVAGALLMRPQLRARILRSKLMMLSAAAFAGTLIALAATALWDHHLQLLAFPITCGAALALISARNIEGMSTAWVARGIVVALGCFFLATSLLMNRPSTWKLRQWAAAPTTAVSDALNAAAARQGLRPPVSYFHFGENDEMGSGAFVSGSLRLACPRFHQYPFLAPAQLQETLSCVRRAAPQLIAVTPSFTYYRGGGPFGAWNEFVAAGRRYLRSSCKSVVARSQAHVYVCR